MGEYPRRHDHFYPTMNPVFILMVCVGCFFLLVPLVANVVFNAAVGSDSPPAPWMRRFRRYQDQMANAGWRIQMIPYDDPSGPMTISLKGWRAIVPVVGAFGFFAGLALVFYDDGQYVTRGLVFAIASWLLALFGWWLKNREVKMDWDVAPARCVDRELGKIPPASPGGGCSWAWRLVCEYDYLGIPYRVTPEAHWSSFPSQAAAHKFLDERISPRGECMLRVDPKNPLRTELLKAGVKD
jgi:hypothetical protein